MVLDLRRQDGALLLALFGGQRQFGRFAFSIAFAGQPLGRLFLEAGQALFGALAAFDYKADFRFQPSDLGTGLV